MSKNLETIRHSFSHVLAMAVLELFPKAKLGIGPVVENGFYYDFDFNNVILSKAKDLSRMRDKNANKLRDSSSPLAPQNDKATIEDLPKLQKIIKKIIKQNLDFKKQKITKIQAKKLFKNQKYKLELIKNLENKKITIYKSRDFIDLCKGPHVKNTKELDIKAFKLTKIAGAYWKGDEKNPMLTRIYGVAFENKEKLNNYLELLKQAEKRDHKKIGTELDLFSFHSESPGFVFWHEKGLNIWNELESFGKQIRKKYGYKEIKTPQMAKNSLWITSGHWDHYKEEMFISKVEKETYCLKPMDCPFNILIYKTKTRSYRDLPIRYTEIGRVFRNEKSGQLNGLFRVREISQDDSHIFLKQNQIEKEITNLIKMVKEYYSALGLKADFSLSTRPDDFMGEIKTWDIAEKALENALNIKKIKYTLKQKDGAFYGPKIDVDLKDALGRSWQVATIQLDFQLPGRFHCEYIDKNGKKKTPVMIHAAIFGSFERMIGVLIEHYAGAFPVWLAPEQVHILPISKNHINFSKNILEILKKHNIKTILKDNDETLGKKIRESELQKIPYILIIGDKEIKAKSVSIRDTGQMKIKKFIEKITAEIKNKI